MFQSIIFGIHSANFRGCNIYVLHLTPSNSGKWKFIYRDSKFYYRDNYFWKKSPLKESIKANQGDPSKTSVRKGRFLQSVQIHSLPYFDRLLFKLPFHHISLIITTFIFCSSSSSSSYLHLTWHRSTDVAKKKKLRLHQGPKWSSEWCKKNKQTNKQTNSKHWEHAKSCPGKQYRYIYLENIVYHYFGQVWLVTFKYLLLIFTTWFQMSSDQFTQVIFCILGMETAQWYRGFHQPWNQDPVMNQSV